MLTKDNINKYLNNLGIDIDYYLASLDNLDGHILQGDKDYFLSKIERLAKEFKKINTNVQTNNSKGLGKVPETTNRKQKATA